MSLLVACGSGDSDADPTPTEQPVQTATPQTTEEPSLAIGAVTWTLSMEDSGEPGEAVTQFSRLSDVIYAAAPVEHAPAGTELTANWTIDGLSVEGVSDTVVIEQGAVSGWVSFSLTWNGAALWPVGELGVTITASTGQSSSGTVIIASS